jgi:hypothetical protein
MAKGTRSKMSKPVAEAIDKMARQLSHLIILNQQKHLSPYERRRLSAASEALHDATAFFWVPRTTQLFEDP